jgi:peroxiredoxin
MSQLPIGIEAPDFELYGVDGQSYRLADALNESSMILAFYKSACPTSQFTLPYLQKIYAHGGDDQVRTQRLGKKGLKIWGVSQDDESETRAFAQRHGIGFQLLIDEHPYPVSTAYGLEFVPGIFIVEPDGFISMSYSGFHKSALNKIASMSALSSGRSPLQLFERSDRIPDIRPG